MAKKVVGVIPVKSAYQVCVTIGLLAASLLPYVGFEKIAVSLAFLANAFWVWEDEICVQCRFVAETCGLIKEE